MILPIALLAVSFQGKIAPVEADRFVAKSNGCVLVKPGKKESRVAVVRVIWGSGLKPGDHIRLKGYGNRDYTGGPDEGKVSDFMTYRVEHRSIVFLGTPPTGVSLSPEERFAFLPMIAFGGSRLHCRPDYKVPPTLDFGGVVFSPSMKRSHRDSVSLDELIQELKRIRADQTARSRTGSLPSK